MLTSGRLARVGCNELFGCPLLTPRNFRNPPWKQLLNVPDTTSDVTRKPGGTT